MAAIASSTPPHPPPGPSDPGGGSGHERHAIHRSVPLPLFNPRALAAGQPPEPATLQVRLSAAHRWVICTPEYNGSFPPVLTSAIADLITRLQNLYVCQP